eukprot:s4057_g2.t1
MCGRDESSPCYGLAGEESLTCSWGEEVRSCMKTFCKCNADDATDACKLCQEDMDQVSMCCDQHRQSSHPPRICTDAILTLDVMNCIDTSCSSCEGPSEKVLSCLVWAIGGRDQVVAALAVEPAMTTDKLFFVNGQRATKAEAGIPEEEDQQKVGTVEITYLDPVSQKLSNTDVFLDPESWSRRHNEMRFLVSADLVNLVCESHVARQARFRTRVLFIFRTFLVLKYEIGYWK